MLGFEPVATESIASHYYISGLPWNPSTTFALSGFSAPAERLFFGQPDFTVMDTGTNSALSATASPAGDRIVRCHRIDLSFSKAPTAGTTVKVYDGTDLIYSTVVAAVGKASFRLNFGRRGLRGSRGNTLSVNVDAAGAGCVQTVSFTGDYQRAP